MRKMDKTEQFYETVKAQQTAILSTAADNSVTMRVVSPVLYKNSILMFTGEGTQKYQQLKANPHCCVSVGSFFAEAEVEFCGATMLPENEDMRKIYDEKFPGAFDEWVEFGGRNAEFLLLTPTRLTGWAFENDIPNESGIPTIPFDIKLK